MNSFPLFLPLLQCDRAEKRLRMPLIAQEILETYTVTKMAEFLKT